ncbi:MAG: hypothetical protein LQ338_005730, partial [Usnochroma carphineum]
STLVSQHSVYYCDLPSGSATAQHMFRRKRPNLDTSSAASSISLMRHIDYPKPLAALVIKYSEHVLVWDEHCKDPSSATRSSLPSLHIYVHQKPAIVVDARRQHPTLQGHFYEQVQEPLASDALASFGRFTTFLQSLAVLRSVQQSNWLFTLLQVSEDEYPVIVDEVYNLVHSECLDSDWEHCQGLLGHGNNPAALLSMSGYEKQPSRSVNAYSTSAAPQADNDGVACGGSRSLQGAGYSTYGHPGFANNSAQASSELYDQDTGRLAFPTELCYEPCAGYFTRQASYSQLNSQSIATVTSWSPDKGSQGTPLRIDIKSNYDLTLPSSPKISLLFATQQCPAVLKRGDPRSTACDYVIIAEAPTLISTGWRGVDVPIRLQLQDPAGVGASTIELGYFCYTDYQRSLMPSPQGIPPKPTVSPYLSGLMEIPGMAAKNALSQQLFSRASYRHVPSPYRTESPSHSSASRSIPHSPSTADLSAYGATENHVRRRSLTFCGGSVRSYPPHTPWTPASSSSYALNHGPKKNVAVPAEGLSKTPGLLTSRTSANFPLIRHLELVREMGPDAPNDRATLDIYGDLDSMASNWTPDEWANKRRVVQFRRAQNGTAVSTTFESVTLEARSPRGACVSCIWWEARQEHFVTSVDINNLLEFLVGISFIVEERNRVRRNVDGFHSITTGKGRPETEDLFNIITGFTDYKPRKIAKAIKVFAWKDLGNMLRKVMGFYCADYRYITTINTHRRHVSAMAAEKKRDILSHRAYAPTSQPDHLAPDVDYKTETYSNSPGSTTNSTYSSVYSGASWQSSTSSPNIPHGLPATTAIGHLPPLEAFSTHSTAPALPIGSYGYKYSGSMQYPYATTEALSPGSMQATAGSQPAQASWGYSQYSSTADNITSDGRHKPQILQP